jgi:uncharacterized lipoprotein YddW (UPF0748 family)
MQEIAQKYPDIDGLQYDYIRYPFHNEQLGLNYNNWKSFTTQNQEYKALKQPTDPNKMDSKLLANWNDWKAQVIDTFVEETSDKLHRTNPKLDISAAVYPLDLNESVRQHWALWMRNSSIDTLNPMTYVPHDPNSKDAILNASQCSKFKQDILSIKAAANGNGDILPGIEIARVNSDGVIKEMEVAQQAGFNGETLFATSVLSEDRLKKLDIMTARTDLANYAQLTAAWSKLGANETRQQRREFANEAGSINITVSALPAAASRAELEALIATTSTEEATLTRWLDKNPSEQSIWTKQMLDDIDAGTQSLTAASKPQHFKAWDQK